MGDDIHIRTIEKVKKNLVLSFIMLLIALVAVSGVTFAYFSSSQNGATNTVTIGEFDFLTSGVKTESGYYKIKAPTIINAPIAIEKPTLSVPPQNPGESDPAYQARKAQYMTDYNAKLTAYLTDGDDRFFNNYCIVIPDIVVTNNSSANMSITASAGAQYIAQSPPSVTGDYSSAFLGFVFNASDSIALKNSADTINYGKYGEKIRALSVGNADTSGATAYEKTKNTLKATQGKQATTLPSATINAGVVAPSTTTLTAVVWLDYRGYKAVMDTAAARPDGKVKISITITAVNT